VVVSPQISSKSIQYRPILEAKEIIGLAIGTGWIETGTEDGAEWGTGKYIMPPVQHSFGDITTLCSEKNTHFCFLA